MYVNCRRETHNTRCELQGIIEFGLNNGDGGKLGAERSALCVYYGIIYIRTFAFRQENY